MNRTQCPYCFTIFLISDEQMRISKGTVRCGSCRERFHVSLVDENGNKVADQFKLQDPFLEPLTEENKVARPVINQPITDFKLKTDVEDNSVSPQEDHIKSVNSIDRSTEDQIPESTTPPAQIAPTEQSAPKDTAIDAPIDTTIDVQKEKARQYELRIGEDKSEPKSQANTYTETDRNESDLIDQVDQLISDKLVNQPTTSENTQDTVPDNEQRGLPYEKSFSEKPSVEQAVEQVAEQTEQINNEPVIDLFNVVEVSPAKKFGRWCLNILLFLLICCLLIALIYQLWFKQLLVLEDRSDIERAINESVELSNQQLKQFDVQLPQRRNLKELTLLSAQVEPHPTRASTILLRVSIINRANIAQPLPWLELSLTNEEGRIIARRSLDPDTYLHNNRTANQIRAKELKKVTIELLSFPKQANGYELKIINK